MKFILRQSLIWEVGNADAVHYFNLIIPLLGVIYWIQLNDCNAWLQLNKSKIDVTWSIWSISLHMESIAKLKHEMRRHVGCQLSFPTRVTDLLLRGIWIFCAAYRSLHGVTSDGKKLFNEMEIHFCKNENLWVWIHTKLIMRMC